MRKGIITEIYNLMKENNNTYFLTGDLGYNTLEEIEKDFPKRFINVGIAEQNMIGIASGLALAGKKVFVYSIIPFVTMRCFEQIRNDVCYHDLDVTILGAGAGLSYGILSSTHFALEDIAILRSLPNMTIFSPADEQEAISGTKFFKNYHHPLYIRIGKKEEPKIFSSDYRFHFGKGKIVKQGSDYTIFTTGPILTEVINAVKIIESKRRIQFSIIDIHTIKPIDKALIIKSSLNKKIAFTVEEHGIIGGLGSTVAEIVSQYVTDCKVVRIGTKDSFIKIIGSQDYLRQRLGLDAEGISKFILKIVAP